MSPRVYEPAEELGACAAATPQGGRAGLGEDGQDGAGDQQDGQ